MMAWIALTSVWALGILAAVGAAATKDYCQWETFNASCPEGQVIMMTSAMYGRMRVGRCIPTDYAMGCSVSVLDHADVRCSGRQSCSIKIPDPTFFSAQTCRIDLVSYFEADYECVPVINPLKDDKNIFCSQPQYISDHDHGYISSLVTAETGLGTRSCPWHIKAKPGQRINVTLFDFSARPFTPSSSSDSSDYTGASTPQQLGPCHVHAHLREGDSVYGVNSFKKEVRICGQNVRRKWLYESRDNSLLISMVNVTYENLNNLNFLLYYEVIGCPDIQQMPNTNIQRNGDSLIVSCNHTSKETWHLVCKGTEWVGEYHNCSSSRSKMAMEVPPEEEHGFPLGLLVAIAIGVVVGVVLGFVFLIGIFVCRRRKRQQYKNDSGNPLMGGTPMDADHQNIYRLVEVRPPPPMFCECHLTPGSEPKFSGTLDNKTATSGECIYRTAPRFSQQQECIYQPRDTDTYQLKGSPLKTCDIISDLHLPSVGGGGGGGGSSSSQYYPPAVEDCYTVNKPVRDNSSSRQVDARIKPFPTFGRDGTERPITANVDAAPANSDVDPVPDNNVFETTVYQPR